MVHYSSEQDEFFGGVPPIERFLFITGVYLDSCADLIFGVFNSRLPPSDEVTQGSGVFSPCHAAHFTLRDQN